MPFSSKLALFELNRDPAAILIGWSFLLLSEATNVMWASVGLIYGRIGGKVASLRAARNNTNTGLLPLALRSLKKGGVGLRRTCLV